MHELQSHPGLQFYVLKLDGTLKYSISRNGKAAKEYELSDTDFEDASNSEIKEEQGEAEPIVVGTEASAVGLQIHIIKNDGRLNMEFEGSSGGHASWTFENLREVKGGPVYANIETQTDCMETRETGVQTEVGGGRDAFAQTDTAKCISTATQTETVVVPRSNATTEASSGTNISIPPSVVVRYAYFGFEGANKKRFTIDQNDLQPEPKRRKSTEENVIPSKEKRTADVAQRSDEKRFLFIRGYKGEPRKSSNYGVVRIDMSTKEAIWHEKSGHPWDWRLCQCNIDLRESKLKVEIIDLQASNQKPLDPACERVLQITYPAGPKNARRFTLQLKREPDMVESDSADSESGQVFVDEQRIINAINKCIAHQSTDGHIFQST